MVIVSLVSYLLTITAKTFVVMVMMRPVVGVRTMGCEKD